jgi:hypothetical protein
MSAIDASTVRSSAWIPGTRSNIAANSEQVARDQHRLQDSHRGPLAAIACPKQIMGASLVNDHPGVT